MNSQKEEEELRTDMARLSEKNNVCWLKKNDPKGLDNCVCLTPPVR